MSSPAAYMKAWKAQNAEHVRQYEREWRAKNREKLLCYRRAYRHANFDTIRELERIARKKNPERHRMLCRESRKRRLERNPSFRMAHYLGNRMRKTMRGAKGAKTVHLLGCSIEDFWLYLESKFEPGMTRQNYGSVWHVDHIMPCAIFDLTKLDHQKRCFHFSNMQPLLAQDNRRKHTKLVTNQFNLL